MRSSQAYSRDLQTYTAGTPTHLPGGKLLASGQAARPSDMPYRDSGHTLVPLLPISVASFSLLPHLSCALNQRKMVRIRPAVRRGPTSSGTARMARRSGYCGSPPSSPPVPRPPTPQLAPPAVPAISGVSNRTAITLTASLIRSCMQSKQMRVERSKPKIRTTRTT